jgi:antitoxin CptB
MRPQFIQGAAMTAMTDREHKTKRLRFRAWHRGTRELDLLIGRFADAHLETMDDDQLTRFEVFMERPDPDVYDWLVKGLPVPDEDHNDIIDLIFDFHKLS